MSNETVELSFSKFSIGNVDIVFAVLYFFLSLIGIAGNALVISVVRRTRSMHTTTNFLLVNLAVADILTLVTCPRNGYSLALIAHHPSGLPGDYICKFLTGNALVGITVSVSSMTLTVLAVERYRALMKLVNLAVADVVTLLWNPRTYAFSFYPSHPRGILGDYICKIFTGNAVISVAIGASILTLTTLAVERYHALVKPMSERLRVKIENIGYVIAALWVLALLINLPDFAANEYDAYYGRCVCPYSLELITEFKVHVLCTVTFLGFLPFLILGFCYFQIIKGIFFEKTIIGQSQGTDDEKSKRKIAKLLISVTVAFYICYLPYGMFISFLTLSKRESLVEKQDTFLILLRLFEFFVTCSSFANPILYAFQSSNYRNGFKMICFSNRKVTPAMNNFSVTRFYKSTDFRRKKEGGCQEISSSIADGIASENTVRNLYGTYPAETNSLPELNKTVRMSNVDIEVEEKYPSRLRSGTDGDDIESGLKRPSIIAWSPTRHTGSLNVSPK